MIIVFGVCFLVFITLVTYRYAFGPISKKEKKTKKEKKRKLTRREKKVVKWSHRLLWLRELNQTYAFYDVPENMFVKYEVSSRGRFQHFDYDGAFFDYVYKNASELAERIEMTQLNTAEYEAYLEEVRIIPSNRTSVDAERCRIREKTFCRIEEALFEETMLPPPKMRESVEVQCVYDTPAGRHHYEDSRFYGEEAILTVIEKAQEVSREPEEEDARARARYERRLMSSKLRYYILARDGSRCALCGRSPKEDGVKLEIDHIIPVSKGGKTVPENLRVLCADCNRGKGASLEEAPNET